MREGSSYQGDGLDEEWGLSELVLEIGTEIEIPNEDAQGATFWIAGEVSSFRTGSLSFKVEFPGCELDVGIWSQTRNRADMEITWRLPPIYNFRERQSAVHMILNTHGYTPWHHPHHGSHWLRLQPRGAWAYGDHESEGDEQSKVYGWRKALATMHIGHHGLRGQGFTMRSAIENHMSKEDLGPEASK